MNKNWIRDIFLVPLAIALVVASFAFFLPLLFEKKKQISFHVAPAVSVLDKRMIKDVQDIKITFKGKETNDLEILAVKVWNSGQMPVKDMRMSYVFEPVQDQKGDFQVFSVSHD